MSKKNQKRKVKIEKLNEEDAKVFERAEKIVKMYNKKRNTAILAAITILAVLAAIVIVFSTIFAIMNFNNTKIIKGVSILGEDVSNLSKAEAINKINQKISERITTDIVLKHNEETYSFLPEQIELKFNVEEAVEKAHELGRNGDIFTNNFTILTTDRNKKDFNVNVTINQDKLQELMNEINEKFADGIKQPTYSVDGNTLTITAGTIGAIADVNKLANLIVEKEKANEFSTDSIEIPTTQKEPDAIDIDKVHNEIYKSPVDATFTRNPYKITSSETGLDFAISVDEAKEMLKENKSEYKIKLKTLYPSVTTDSITAEAFPDLIASFSTSFASSNANRATNVILATARFNGKVIMPGEKLSFNSTVGKRTPARGYKEAAVYVNGETSTDYGGGICQVSSTLYNATLRANLGISDRSNHMFTVGYVPIGTDATVSWGAPDFVFKNTRNYPIKIVATSSGRIVNFKIYGLKEDADYDIEVKSTKTGTIPFKTTYTTDPTLPKGTEKIIQKGSNGSTSITYKIYKKNGATIKTEVLSRDSYNPHNQIIARGTK